MKFPAKVLMVDDEPHVRAFIGKIAESRLGAPAFFEAADGASALNLFRQEQPDLILLDLNLVGVSGLDVLEQIRALDDEVVIIMLSSVSVRSAIQDAVEHGANGYVLKNLGSEKVAQSLVAAVAESFGEDESS